MFRFLNKSKLMVKIIIVKAYCNSYSKHESILVYY